MNDDEFLHGYRPAGPPAGLRARIVNARRRLRDWLPALAAAAVILLFAALSYRVNTELDSRLMVPDDLRPVEQWGVFE